MHPILLKLGPLELRAYGVMLAISFIVGIYLAARRAEKKGWEKKHVMDISMYLMIGAIVGARLFYVLFHIPEFKGNLLGIINPFQDGHLVGIAGMNMYGGVIGGMILGFGFLYIRKLNLLKFGDLLIPFLALGTGITRIGCFLNGCCFGFPTDSCLGVSFPENSIPGSVFGSTPLHPTQLYSSLAGFIMFFTLLYIDNRKKTNGVTFFSWVIMYAIFRFLIEFIRYYEDAMIMMNIGGTPITMNQAIAVVLVVLSAVVIAFLRNQRKKKEIES